MKKPDIGYWLGEAEQVIVGGWRLRKARTLNDLRAANVADLIDERGDDVDRPADDPHAYFYEQTATEIALNRAGFLTGVATVGGVNTAVGFEYRAAVTGFADDETKDWLYEITSRAGYLLFVPSRPRLAIPARGPYGIDTVRSIRTHEVVPRAQLGQRMTAREIFMLYPVRRSLGRQLRRCWQVTVYDPQWGSRDLFPFLLAAARDRQQELAQI